MCGIFGYIGYQDAAKMVAIGLKRLEYRGYDSWGIAVISEKLKVKSKKLFVEKQVGSIGDTKTFNSKLLTLNSSIGIGHTRWATHGGVTKTNAHPHFSTDKSFALAQNGIVENYTELKSSLSKKGYKFETETDTEVIVRLIEDKQSLRSKDLKQKLASHLSSGNVNLKEAVRLAFLELEGRNTIILISNDGQVIACRNGSPLIIGKNFKTGEIYLSSDTLSFAPFANKMLIIENGQLVQIIDKNITISDLSSGKVIKNKFENFAKIINECANVYTIGSGTIGVAAAQIAFYLRLYGKKKVISLIGADSVEYLPLFKKGDLIIAPSQSGETADVLEVLEKAKQKGVKIASIVNMPGSSMTRLSDYKFMMQAGAEICVMFTKAYIFPIAWGYLLSKVAEGKIDDGIKDLKNLSIKMDKWLEDEDNHKSLKSLASFLIDKKDIFLLG